MARRGADYWREEAAKAAREEHVPVDLFVAQIEAESNFDDDVIYGRRNSSAGAQGIAQIMPETAKGWGVNPLRPKQALRAAAKAMRGYIEEFGESGALRAYNAGPGNVARSHGFAETNAYVNRIQAHRSRYKGLAQGGASSSRRQGGTRAPRRGRQATVSSRAPALPASASAQTLAAQLSQQQPVAVSGPPAPAFAASAVGPGGQRIEVPSVAPAAPAARVADSIAQEAVSVESPASTTSVKVGGGGGAPRVKNGRVLVVGDSLGVGTAPVLQQAGVKLDAHVKGGVSSAAAVKEARQAIRSGRYGTIVFDLGTNDVKAHDTVQSLRQVLREAPDARVVVLTVNSPWDEDRKNRALRTIAANHPNVQLVRWHAASRAGAILPDGIHGAYDKRARLILQKLGQDPHAPARGEDREVIRPHGHWGGAEGPTVALFKKYGKPLGLTVTSNKRNNTNPYSGSRSDHDYGNKDAYAIDASNGSSPTPEMDEYAFRLMRALGDRTYKKGTPIDTSRGVFHLNGLEIQVIYRGSGEAFGGNHLNHVHLGIHRAR